MNRAAQTNNVAYSAPWELGVTTGKQYLENAYDSVGRRYGEQLLHEPTESALHDYRGGLSNFQKALVQHLVATKNKQEFDEALYACTKNNVLSGGAAMLFAPHTEVAPVTESMLAPHTEVAPVTESMAPPPAAPAMASSLRDAPAAPGMASSLLDDDMAPVGDLMDMDDVDTAATTSRLAPTARRGANEPALKLMPKRKKQKS
jgi:hypothetical protein